MPFAPGVLKQLDSALVYSDLLYSRKDHSLGFDFNLSFMPTPGIENSIFVYGDQHYTYRNGPQSWEQFHWPSHQAFAVTDLIAIPSNEQKQITKEFSGEWGLFHLIDQLPTDHIKNNVLRARWLVKHRGKAYTIRLFIKTKSFEHGFLKRLTTLTELPLELMSTDVYT